MSLFGESRLELIRFRFYFALSSASFIRAPEGYEIY